MAQSFSNTVANIPPLQLWGGMECTVNRVEEAYFDQIITSGHQDRLEDLDNIAALGIKTLRYPVIWERVAPDGLETADWTWTDERLNRLKVLGIRPIVGLVHHGSGPRYTSLVDPEFPEKLALFAKAVAERYPWVDAYTPVNEPLTTARFSGLYGHWYPHGQNDFTFLTALINQCKGSILAMQAIRTINAEAEFIQTEDFGQTYATDLLTYQASLENERRLLSFDLLCGAVDNNSAMGRYMLEAGILPEQLGWFQQNPCPPDILGINYYLTSDRFLDEHHMQYPSCAYGGNGLHEYADVEAVRVCPQGISGYEFLLNLLWNRYRRPLAITEVHVGCSREEQLRWLNSAWKKCQEIRSQGVDLRAITVWALLGSFDWNSLVTKQTGFYESGVFDLRSPIPRPTALARLVRCLAQGEAYHHPILEIPGWWERPDRMLFSDTQRCSFDIVKSSKKPLPWLPQSTKPVLITGARGTLGQAFARMCDLRGIPYRLLTRQELDISDPLSVNMALDSYVPWAVINTAGYVQVDKAEQEAERCYRENTLGPEYLAYACERHGAKLITFSSDLVFGGDIETPYVESHSVYPLGIYGMSKAESERRVLEILPSALVIRTSAFFGPWDSHNFITVALNSLSSHQPFTAARDMIVSPTYVPDLVNVALDLLIDGEEGLWHLANKGSVSWAELATMSATMAGVSLDTLTICNVEDLSLPAKRPAYSVLGSEKGFLMPTLTHALEQYFSAHVKFSMSVV